MSEAVEDTKGDGTISIILDIEIQTPRKTIKSVSYKGKSLTIRMLAKHSNSIRGNTFVPADDNDVLALEAIRPTCVSCLLNSYKLVGN